MTLFIMGFIIFICGMFYRVLVLAEKQSKEARDKIVCSADTRTMTGGIE